MSFSSCRFSQKYCYSKNNGYFCAGVKYNKRETDNIFHTSHQSASDNCSADICFSLLQRPATFRESCQKGFAETVL
jgi:hypothetical protein